MPPPLPSSELPGPLPDETAGSIAWRMARSRHQAVADYCTSVFGLSYSQARGDLDNTLPNQFANRFTKGLSIGQRSLKNLRIGAGLLVSAYRPSTKRFNQPVRICFPCMNAAPYGRRFWRTCFANACPLHACLMVSSCPNCGAGIYYQEGNVGLSPLLWLETWPVCTNCLRTMRPSPEPANDCLVRISAKWAAAVAGEKPYPWIAATQYLRLSTRLLRSFECDPRYITARTLVIQGRTISPHHAAALVLSRIWRARVPTSIAQAALGVPFEPCQISKDMVS